MVHIANPGKDDHGLAVLATRLCYAGYFSVGCHSMVDA